MSYYLTLSSRKSLPYRNQSIDLQSKLIDWFLYDRDLRHERVTKRERARIANLLFDENEFRNNRSHTFFKCCSHDAPHFSKIIQKSKRRKLEWNLVFCKVAPSRPVTLVNRTLLQLFSCAFSYVFQKTFFVEHIWDENGVKVISGSLFWGSKLQGVQ